MARDASVGVTRIARRLWASIIEPRGIENENVAPGPSLAETPREFATALALAPGMEGAALTTLRPSGKARFANHVVDVVTEGEYIAAETPVTVIQADGMRVVVKKLG